MAFVSDSAYPRLSKKPEPLELARAFTPTENELDYAAQRTRTPGARLAFLVLLKAFQRIGYFEQIADIPPVVIHHVAVQSGLLNARSDLRDYDGPYRQRLQQMVREYLEVHPYDLAARRIAVDACMEAAQTREDLPDIINVALENLVCRRYELPAFDTLRRMAITCRKVVNRNYHRLVNGRLTPELRDKLTDLTKVPLTDRVSPWDAIKDEAKRPSVKHMKEYLEHAEWLASQTVEGLFEGVPQQKVKQFAAAAGAYNAADLEKIKETRKRFTLMAALIQHRRADALDSLARMFIRQNESMHGHARDALEKHRNDRVGITEALVDRLHRAILAARDEEVSLADRHKAALDILLQNVDVTIEQCEGVAATAGDNYIPFLGRMYYSQRRGFIGFLQHARPHSTSQDRTIEDAIAFVLENCDSHQRRIKVIETLTNGKDRKIMVPLLDLSFVSNKWWPHVTGQKAREPAPETVDRHFFELCVFAQVVDELKSGDLFIAGSEEYADYTAQLVSQEDYTAGVETLCEQIGFPADPKEGVAKLKKHLAETAEKVDKRFPHNHEVAIVDGEPTLRRMVAVDKAGKMYLEQLIKVRLEKTDILKVLADTELCLNWTKNFGPVSGMQGKIESSRERYVATTFCYGCALGPAQTARCLKWADRKQIAMPNHRHITEADLDKAINQVIEVYERMDLHKYWGSGRTASADGTKRDTHPQSLTTEYHIRHGGYGGIGYYIVSDTYIALFSRFIPCGAYEGHMILDFLTEKRTALQPETIHGDTHSQSEPIFGVSYMLGIDLMPYIRNWQDLILYLPDAKAHYEHIGELFGDCIDWKVIEEHLPDILRVIMSIKAGKFPPSTVLRRLSTHSRKNRLYFAFKELGRVIRTVFLLRYLDSAELRRNIRIATNKSELHNELIQWISFGKAGLIHARTRDEERKMIKYNHLVANLLVLHNIAGMTRALRQVREDGFGHAITKEALSGLTPYISEHINRFGVYELDLSYQPSPLPFDMEIMEEKRMASAA